MRRVEVEMEKGTRRTRRGESGEVEFRRGSGMAEVEGRSGGVELDDCI